MGCLIELFFDVFVEGFVELISYCYMSNLWSYATLFNGAAVAMALVVCGLSMADKYFVVNDRQQ
jgi:hypothetical protein